MGLSLDVLAVVGGHDRRPAGDTNDARRVTAPQKRSRVSSVLQEFRTLGRTMLPSRSQTRCRCCLMVVRSTAWAKACWGGAEPLDGADLRGVAVHVEVLTVGLLAHQPSLRGRGGADLVLPADAGEEQAEAAGADGQDDPGQGGATRDGATGGGDRGHRPRGVDPGLSGTQVRLVALDQHVAVDDISGLMDGLGNQVLVPTVFMAAPSSSASCAGRAPRHSPSIPIARERRSRLRQAEREGRVGLPMLKTSGVLSDDAGRADRP